MRRLALALVLSLAACVSEPEAGPSTTAPPVTSTTESGATTTTAAPSECPSAPYELTFLPFGVGSGSLDTDDLEPDVWTSVPGTNTTFVPRDDESVAIALIRGTLPAVDWPAEKGEVSIDGTPGVAGPHADGTWAVGWFEQPGERCDLYSMIFYPPWSPGDVESVISGMDRVGG